jgi:hypothetical protein
VTAVVSKRELEREAAPEPALGFMEDDFGQIFSESAAPRSCGADGLHRAKTTLTGKEIQRTARFPMLAATQSLRPDSQQSTERKHDGSGLWTFWFEIVCVFSAIGLIIAHFVVLWQHREHWTLWQVAGHRLGVACSRLCIRYGALVGGYLGERKVSDLRSEDLSVPFRVHHVTPTSFLECNFFDTNGDTCLIAIPILL